MEGVGPGSVLAGRYTVGALVRQSAGAQRWTAREPVLGRSVSLLILPSGDSRAAAVLDAARMAAGLDIPGCVRILDIGQEGPAAWVVEEALADAKSVVDLVRNGGLPGDEVRRIVGEAATSLDAAAARGLHHLRITPEEVFRTPEGDIKVRGLATEAALHGAEEDSVSADRTDAVCLVALTYAALTGLWPLRDLPSALPPAPRLVHGVPAPSEIAAGVPRDLDTLCRLTFGGTGGPTSPGDYARQIAPWSSRQIFGRPTLPEAAPVAAAAPVVVTPPAEPAVAAPAAASPAMAAPTPVGPDAAAPAVAVTPTAAVPPVAATQPIQPAAPVGAAAAATADTAKSPATAPPKAPTPAVGGSTAPAARPAAAQGAGASARARAAAATSRGAARVRALPRPNFPGMDADAPAPLVPTDPLTKDESKVALSIVAAFVLMALVVGIMGVSKIGSQTNFDLSVGSGKTAKPSASPSATAAEPAGPQPLAILSADGFDPDGDGKENGQSAPKVFDGDPNTAWMSEGYKTPNLGGLKPGVGVIVDLGPNVTPKHVDLTLGAPASLEIYVAADRSLTNATKVAEATDAKGAFGFDLPPDQTAGKQYLIVWFTNLSQVDGFYRAVLGEVSVLG
ncbi:MAG: hypothetical protein H6520_13260 [Tetrasphaera sp.]|nr:hypothetical protein [Tetrasphaera sp.]